MGAAEADGLADTQVMDEDQASVAKVMRAERPSRSHLHGYGGPSG